MWNENSRDSNGGAFSDNYDDDFFSPKPSDKKKSNNAVAGARSSLDIPTTKNDPNQEYFLPLDASSEGNNDS